MDMPSSNSTEATSPDPVIDAYKSGIDVTLIRENLRKTPEQRLRDLQELQAFAEELRKGGSEMRRKRDERL